MSRDWALGEYDLVVAPRLAGPRALVVENIVLVEDTGDEISNGAIAATILRTLLDRDDIAR